MEEARQYSAVTALTSHSDLAPCRASIRALLERVMDAHRRSSSDETDEHLHRHHPLDRSGEGFTKGQYSRAHEWAFDGGAVVPARAEPAHRARAAGRIRRGSIRRRRSSLAVVVPHAVLPRFRAAGGVTIDGYVDEAEGVLEKNADGEMAMIVVDFARRARIADRATSATAEGRAVHANGDDGKMAIEQRRVARSKWTGSTRSTCHRTSSLLHRQSVTTGEEQ